MGSRNANGRTQRCWGRGLDWLLVLYRATQDPPGVFALMICLCVAFFGFAGTSKRQAAAQDDPQKRVDLRELIEHSATEYTVYKGADQTSPLKLRRVLRWVNNTRGSEDGATFVWIAKGRPEAIACFYPWRGDICDNFQSLSRGPLTVQRKGQTVWSPTESGVEFHPVPDAPRPSDSAAARLVQMKLLARRFSMTLVGWAVGDPDREELRMMPQPIYRYEGDDLEVLDGALFAFVQGTDPEGILLLESVRKPTGDEWLYAFARRTSGALEARCDGKTLWKVAKEGDWHDAKKPHFQFEHKIEL